MAYKKWSVSKFDKELAASLAQECEINPFAALLAVSRGIMTKSDITDFFSREYSCYADPYDFPDMKKAVNRINIALDKDERITIVGDFDADGVTSTAIMFEFLTDIGANVSYYIPSRHTEGYGLSYSIIDKLAADEVTLIITVDNGISCVEETEYAKALGIDMVITDHHRPGEVLPAAVAVVNPHRADCMLPFRDYAGVGVAFKLICALSGEESESTFYDFADLVAIGTIGDVVPLRGENRTLVISGLGIINSHPRIGVIALQKVALTYKKPQSAMSVAFSLVPRLNAVGRMADAELALKLLLSEDDEEALELATELDNLNTERQSVEKNIFAQAVEQINKNPERKFDRVMLCSGEGWHPGVIGIVASRMVEKYGKPCIVISVDGDTAKGSGRSMEGFSMYDALTDSADLLTNYGGHHLAAGLGLHTDKIEEFRIKINKYAESLSMPVPVQKIDFKLNPKYLNFEVTAAVDMLSPFGAGNTQPVFGLYKMNLLAIQPVSNGKHLRLITEKGGVKITVMRFGVKPDAFKFQVGDVIDIAATVDENEYNGDRQISVIAKNIRFSGLNEDGIFSGIDIYESIKRKEALSSETATAVLPSRSFVAEVFKVIKASNGWKWGTIAMCRAIGDDGTQLVKVLLAIDAMHELGIIEIANGGIIMLPKEQSKVNLEDAAIFKFIRNCIQ